MKFVRALYSALAIYNLRLLDFSLRLQGAQGFRDQAFQGSALNPNP